VRFGSFLDDPNGFGLLLSWFIPFAAVYFKGIRRVGVVGLLLVSLLLTQSLTAVATFLVVSALLVALYVVEYPRAAVLVLSLAISGIVAVTVPVIVYWEQLVDAYTIYMHLKLGSINKHAEALKAVEEIELLNVAGIQPLVERWVETAYVNLLMYFGVAYVVVYVLVGISGMIWYLQLFRNRAMPREVRCFGFGALGLLLAVYVANFNLPVISIFPLDLLTVLLLGIASARIGVEEAQRAVTKPPRAPETRPLVSSGSR
jgi:hypothetical protein